LIPTLKPTPIPRCAKWVLTRLAADSVSSIAMLRCTSPKFS
jgi:hypothetical protein